jgi:hypothetical protein
MAGGGIKAQKWRFHEEQRWDRDQGGRAIEILVLENAVSTICGAESSYCSTMGSLRQGKNAEKSGMPTALGKRVVRNKKRLEIRARQACMVLESGLIARFVHVSN